MLWPGLGVSVIVAAAAQFLADHYGVPTMLMALLLGIAMSFLGEEGRVAPGIAFTSQHVLRLGVALLGMRISIELLRSLGPSLIALVVAAVVATILFGLGIARFFGHGWRFALLTAGSVAICGASAAMALSAILPRDERSEQRLIFTVLGVTVLSTLAMIAYPVLVTQLDLSATASGIFLGATIHDVAQVVGAGFSVSEQTGDTATLVKLIRVTLLAPVVLISSVTIRARTQMPHAGDERPPLIPNFVLAFLVLAILNSTGVIPVAVVSAADTASQWALLVAISAVGMKTSLKQVLSVGGPAIALICAETIFLAAFVLTGLQVLVG